MFTKDMNTQDRKCRDLIATLLYRPSLIWDLIIAIAKPKKVVTFFFTRFFDTISSNDIVTLDLNSISMLVTLDYLMAWAFRFLKFCLNYPRTLSASIPLSRNTQKTKVMKKKYLNELTLKEILLFYLDFLRK